MCICLVHITFWKKKRKKRQFQNHAKNLVIYYNPMGFLVFVMNINALSGILLEQGFFYCFLPNPPTPCILLLQSYFSSGAPQKDSVKGRKGGYCSAFLPHLFIYLFLSSQ